MTYWRLSDRGINTASRACADRCKDIRGLLSPEKSSRARKAGLCWGAASFGGSRHTVARSGKRGRTHGGGPRKLDVTLPGNEKAAIKGIFNRVCAVVIMAPFWPAAFAL